MANGQFNPLATLATSARQLNEQANQAVKSLGDSFTQTTNQLLATAAQGLPPLPPLPGAQASNPGNGRGNSNGGSGLPQLQQLIPTQALQAVSQVEDVLLPPGIPRPSQTLFQAARPRRQAPPPEETPPQQPARTAARGDRIAGVSEIGARSTGSRLRIKM